MAVQAVTVSPALAAVIDRAGDRNDVDFDYLLQTAIRESSLDPHAKAKTSSATGLFQFLDQTWLEVMKTDGARLGYTSYADAITVSPDGEYDIADKKLKAKVLKLRENPEVAADLAAAYTRNNGAYLKGKFGRMPSAGELYIAHFLGARGAEKLFKAGLSNPDQNAAKLFPRQAAANPSIFYDHGQARSVRQVYKALVAQHDAADKAAVSAAKGQDARFAAQQMAETNENSLAERTLSMSFSALYSNEPALGARKPVVSAPKAAGAGFFTKFYGK